MKFLISVLLLFITITAKSHDPAVASYYIFKDNNQWNIRANFAWSIRNAIIMTYPFLKDKGRNNEEYVDCVKEYMENNISIKIDDRLLAFKSIYQVPGDHTHSYVFFLGLDGPFEGSQMTITNKCQFEFYSTQKNVIYYENKEVCTIVKGKEACTFEIKR